MILSPTTIEVVKACRLYHAGKAQSPAVALSKKRPYTEKGVLRKMQMLVDRGVLEMGFCIRTAWPAGEQTYEPTISNQRPELKTKRKQKKKQVF